MQLIYEYGFSVDADTKRIYLNEGRVAGFMQAIPTGGEGITKGEGVGPIIAKNTKVGLDANNNLVYNDIKGKPYTGTVKYFGLLPHDENDRLLVDSVGEIKDYLHGLAVTVNGALAMDAVDVLKAPVLNNVYPAKNDIVLDFDATEGEEALVYIGYAVGGGKTFTAEVYDPDEDLAITGLTEGTTYECYVTAKDKIRESAPSNKISATCKTVIAAPVFKSCVAGDGFATVTFDPVQLSDPWSIDHYAYSALNMDDKDSPEIEGHIEDGKIILPNDVTWYVRICAVCNPGRVPGDFSDALTVKPEKPSVPYKPRITTCYAQSNGQILVEWIKGSNGKNSTSANTVDNWKVRFKSTDGKGKDFTVEVPTPTPTKILSDKVSIGSWDVFVSAHNDVGWSVESDGANASYNPAVNDPLIGGTSFSDDTYKYCIFDSNATTGYEATRTKEGELTTFEVLLVGAGGGGKGQTVTFGKGGDGGGGELVIGTLPPAYAGSIFVTVPSGGKIQGDSPADTTVKEGQLTLVARAGKTATDKNNAVGYPKTKVPDTWNKLRQFTWLEPLSQYVGGVAESGEQNFPNGTCCGQGGAGTKDSRPGNGCYSCVAIRWKK